MDGEWIHKPGWDNLVPDALSRRVELITPLIFKLVKDELNEVDKDFLDDVRETMKQDEDEIMNNRFFDERCSKKTPSGNRSGLHYFKQMKRRNNSFIISSKCDSISRKEN